VQISFYWSVATSNPDNIRTVFIAFAQKFAINSSIFGSEYFGASSPFFVPFVAPGWQKTNKKIISKINDLLKDISRNPFEGLGNPEPLKYKYKGYWSRRIDSEHRLIYRVKDDEIQIAKCRFHYD